MVKGRTRIITDIQGLQKTLGLKGFSGRLLSGLLFSLLKMRRLNRLQEKYTDLYGADLSLHVLNEVGVSFKIPPQQLENIPKDGGFIIVSNHHYGTIDGLILEAIIGTIRPDFKILTTFFLASIPGLHDSFIPVDNFSAGVARNRSGIRNAVEHLSAGHPLGLFPAGEVATWQKKDCRTSVCKKRVIEDKPWSESLVRLIKHSKLPVVPVYFSGGNSRVFHLLGLIHPRLRTVRLFREMFNKRGRTVEVRFGQPVNPEEIENYDLPTLGSHLRNRCYSLEAQCLPDFLPPVHDWPVHLSTPVSPAIVRDEMDGLSDKALFETGGFRVYLIRTCDAPNVMKELFRLREEAFRRVGEGTGRAEDSDLYDDRYSHLILWNIQDARIAGSYRIGDGGEVMARYGGIESLYTSSLYRYKKGAESILSQSIELGRSFVATGYQGEVLPLKLLLAGLTVSSLKFPDAKYFIGAVSISNDYPAFYKSLITHFLSRDFSLPNACEWVEPPHPFIPDFLSVNPDELLSTIKTGDIISFDRLISALSDGRYRTPVLVRRYFSCSARLACFNVDPGFMNSIDGLILMRLSDFPLQMLQSILRCVPDETAERVIHRFYSMDNQ